MAITSTPTQASGQALVLSLALLLMGAGALITTYHAGQLIHEKNRLLHATDAAVYSGALTQARALNFLALANRAQVAHQVALAHLTALDAWAHYAEHTQDRVTRGNPPGYLIGMLFGPAHGAAYQAAARASDLRSLRDTLTQAAQAHDQIVHEILGRAQAQVWQSLLDTRAQAMQAVLDANYEPTADAASARLDPHLLHDDWPSLLTAEQGRQADTLRALALRAVAHYEFLAPRHYDTRNAWMVSSRCPGLRHELRRRGNTYLDPQDRWWSHDTQSYHAVRHNRWIGCYFREYPMGWAEVNLGSGGGNSTLPHTAEPPTDFSHMAFWRWAQNQSGWDVLRGHDNPLANSWAVAARQHHPGRGLGVWIDFADHAPRSPQRLTIRAMRGQGQLPLMGAGSQLPDAGPRWRPTWNLPGESLVAVAAAEVVFQPPHQLAAEAPTLFAPYWQARLTPSTAGEREQARRRQQAP